VLGAEVAATAIAVGQNLFRFALAEGTGTIEPVPIALAGPLALVAGQIVGRKASALGTGLSSKEGLQIIGQGNTVGIANETMALGTGRAGRRAAQVTTIGLDRGDGTPGAVGTLARQPRLGLAHTVLPFRKLPRHRDTENQLSKNMMVPFRWAKVTRDHLRVLSNLPDR
jgi:hypothetical protein